MKEAAKQKQFITFLPGMRVGDSCAEYWMRQVTIRLRREICWCWHERGLQPDPAFAVLPPASDRASSTLDQTRFWAEKKSFYLSDPTARYLTEQLDTAFAESRNDGAPQGSFGWVFRTLELENVCAFVLALGLAVAFDGSMGSVIAACLNDHSRPHPNLALAQKLWDDPDQVLAIADPLHPLFRYGLIRSGGQTGNYFSETAWDAPLTVPSLIAAQLLFPDAPLPRGLVRLEAARSNGALTETSRLVSLRLKAEKATRLRVVPLLGAKGSAQRETAVGIAKVTGKEIVEFTGDAQEDIHYLNSIATVCWLRDAALYLNNEQPRSVGSDKAGRSALPSAAIPVLLFLGVNDHSQLAHLPSASVLPAVPVAPATYQDRIVHWKEGLGAKAKGLDAIIAEASRRFRFERRTIEAVCSELKEISGPITEADINAACRAELNSDIGELASKVTPRFEREELVLPHKQDVLFAEILKAMQSLTVVHYGWGTGRVWNESGISVLFAGPPGTGKTMAAEILAFKLDLPMYRIDLSQVVNKYIGETEKNLRRVFDAADVSDMILFFDEADSLFGRRTEVSDAHDRYANLEISYLLERMERFKGLAILATNRKRDLDEAFIRRLRYIVDFPLPDVPERKRIWRQAIPEQIDRSEVEIDFLAEQFPLSGGNIRSIVFNASLQCARRSGFAEQEEPGRLTMREIVIAVKREYDKMNRSMSLEIYGPYSTLVEGLERG